MSAVREHWSYSSISQYQKCSLQYYFERVLKLPRPTISGGMVLGSAVHAALADYHLSLQRGRPSPVERLHRVLLANWTLHEAERPIQYRGDENRVVLLATGIALLDAYLQEPPPLEIAAVERTYLAPLLTSEGQYLEKPLMAVVDLLTQEGDQLKVHEFKTSGRAFGQAEVESSLQATCYANAVFQTFEELPPIEFTVLVKTKTPRVQRASTVRTETDLSRLGDIVESVERAIDQKIFFPNETPLNCSTCPYRQPCRLWRPDRRSPQPEFIQLNGHAHAH